MADLLAGKLRDLLFESFNEDELAWLCGSVGEEYQQLPGEGKFGKTRELVRAAAARGQLRLLAARARELKPELTDALAAVSPAGPRISVPHRPRPVQPPTAASLRARAVPALLVVVALLGAWTILSGPLLRPPSPPIPATPTVPQGTVNVWTVPTTATAPAEPAATLAPVQPSPTVLPPTRAPEATVPPLVTPTPLPAGPALTPTISLPPSLAGADPARTVRELNAQLIDYYTGKVEGVALEQFWRDGPRKSVVQFADSPLLELLGLSAQTRSSALDVRMQYAREPLTVQISASSAMVQSREYWRYANTVTGQVLCETRDYTYRLVLEAGRFRVRSFEGELLDARCAN